MSYDIKDLDVAGRIGVLKIGNKTMETPNLFPVVSPFENVIPPRKLYDHFGARALFTNAYITYKSPQKNQKILEQGLHKALDFPGIIATDSGGFQDYMYGKDIKMTPEEIEPFQEKIGSDCPVILDIPVQTTDSYEVAKNKVEETILRARQNITRRTRTDCAWFGPIHGSIYPDLLKKSTEEMSQLNFGIYAIGGVVKTFMDYRYDLDIQILLQVRQWINPTRPLHMFGLGLPSFFALAVACGADTFDSAAYYLYAADGRYFTLQSTKNINDLTELPCNCPICSSHTAQELQKLPKFEQTKALAEHNLYLSFSELRTIRQAIREGNLWELVEQRVRAHPKLVKALQITKDYLPLLEKLAPVDKTRGLKYLSEQSLYRPEVYRYLLKIPQYHFGSTKKGIICLPELDLPGINSATVRDWLKECRKHPKWSNYACAIISNFFGIMPLELSEMYPLSQHEGSPELEPMTEQTKYLLEPSMQCLKANPQIIENVYIFIPKEYSNEFQVTVKFKPEKHLINSLITQLKQDPKVNIHTFNDLTQLLNEI